MSKGAVILSMH